jgi:hypothetical protein
MLDVLLDMHPATETEMHELLDLAIEEGPESMVDYVKRRALVDGISLPDL